MDKPHTRNETNGRAWVMESAQDVRFLAVSGTIWIGDTSVWYEFTLVEYQVYIDEVPWLIFSVLGGASEREFSPEFFKTLNPSRKDTWDFHRVAWLEGKDKYEVSRPYEEFVLSIFDTFGTTLRTVRPFVNTWTHVRVHQHAAAVFAEEKKIVFLLPLIIEAHRLLPKTPVFWKRDDNTIPLARTTMWLHEQTVQWLAKTGEWYPPELRSELQPRIDACRGRQQPRKQPPEPPKPNRLWQEVKRPQTHDAAPAQAATEPPAQTARASQKSPRQEAQKDDYYFKLQKKFAQMIATDLPTANTQSRQQQASASGHQPQPTPLPQNTPTPTKTNEPQASSHKEVKVTAQELAEKRPEPPAPPATTTAKEDAPGTGELSHSATAKPIVENSTTPTRDETPAKAEEKPREEASPTSSPTESSDTLATETAVNSSPEETRAPEYHTAVAEADLPTLRSMNEKGGQEENGGPHIRDVHLAGSPGLP